MSSNFSKMDISVRYDISYKFHSDVINVENKKSLLWPIFMRILDHVVWRPLIYAPSFAQDERPHKNT